ncbi:hypothetical protein F2Q69_00061962 [Brassica cretica]|uniref:Sororin C-terminal region domain-containing protein n=1 Tax=Brassica cretica TaxID=69181 RepID=A0A8S9RED4_BRACR|nr:hypothetical protein F2Q69_00061962 [Brassica cretica]
MEPHRPIARRLHRKPLGDCTNTVSRTTKQQSSSSSSVIKFANPSLTSSLKRLVDQTSLKERNSNDVVNSSKTSPRFVPKSLSTSLRPVTRRVSADLCFPATTPSRRQNSRSGEGVGGGGDKEVAEPYTVYTARRKASPGRKRSNDAVAANLRLDLISSPGKKRRQANENTVKPSKAAPIKRQRTTKHEEDDLASGVSQDYIEKQRAYFAEIDAFELAEEEVSDSDLD